MLKVYRAVALLVIGGLAGACGEPQEEQVDEPAPALAEVPTDEVEEEPIPFDSIPMPDFPSPVGGYLVARGGGPYMMDGAWEAAARMCDDPPTMQLLAQQPGVGTLVLLQLPPEGDRLTDYPVAVAEQGAPPAPASQVAVQLFQGGGATAFQATEGEVTVVNLGDRISGRFAVILREIASEDRQKYAGVFENVPIGQISEEECRQLREALAAPDSVAADSVPQ